MSLKTSETEEAHNFAHAETVFRITDHQDQMNAITTFSGEPFHPLDPRVEDVRIDDIAHALANTVRANGHCRTFYSVAQHSVLVAEWLERHIGHERSNDAAAAQAVQWGLMHDSSEAYLADLCSPIKRAIAGYAELEQNILKTIGRRYSLAWPMPAIVKLADRAIFKSEVDSDILRCGRWWRFSAGHPDAKIRIRALPPEAARSLFLEKFRQLFPDQPLGQLA